MATTPRVINPVFHDIDNLDNDPALATALGNMVIAWANAETALVFAFSAIADIPTNMAIMGYYRIPSLDSRVKMLRAMIEDWKSTKYDKEAIDKAITKLSKLAKTRNDWVHGVWSEEKVSGDIVIFDFRAPVENGRRRPVTASAVLNHIAAVRIRTNALRDLLPDRLSRSA